MSLDPVAEPAAEVADHLPHLLAAVIEIGRDLDLPTVLRRIVEVAVDLMDCQYGALGVIGDGYAASRDEHGRPGLIEFVTTGIEDEERELIGRLPHGEGILGVLVKHPQVLRLPDLTAHPDSVGFPAHHPPMTSFLGVPIRVGETVFGNLYLTQKRSGCFTVADETVVLALATAAGIAIDKARTHAQARRSEQWQRSMARINQQLLAGDDSSDVLALIASSARSMATAEVALIGFDDGDGNLVVEVAEASNPDRLVGAPMPTDKPCILIPFSWQGQNAALCVANPGSEQRFDPDVVSQLQSFAGQAALALELAAARREGERLAVYEDRDRIARDLHDTVVQRLFAAGMQLESISRRLEPNEVSGVQRVVDDLDATIREIRSSIYSLQTVDRATVIGLRARIAGLLDQLRSILGFTPALSIDGPIDAVVGDDAANDVVSVLRELLSNAARHAHASRISVCVSTSGDDIVLVVADDGVGFDVADENARRSGLRNARERAELRGGKFDVRSQEPDEHGWVTRIRWSIPNA